MKGKHGPMDVTGKDALERERIKRSQWTDDYIHWNQASFRYLVF